MNRIVLHVIGYTVVATAAFWGGALCRDYLVTKAARDRKMQFARFQDRPAPGLSGPVLDGGTWSLAQQKGKVVVIDAWATWCAPCVAALPEFKRLHDRFGMRGDFQMVGVSVDKDGTAVRQFCERNAIKWVQLLEPGREFDTAMLRALDVSAVPFVCVIDKQGVIRGYWHAPRDIPPDVDKLVNSLLNQPAGESLPKSG